MKKRQVSVSLCILFCVLLCVLVLLNLVKYQTQTRMLKVVSLQDVQGLQQVGYTYWKDILKYGDGYEIMTFVIDNAEWTPPENWTITAEEKSIEALEAELEIDINENEILLLNSGEISCESWFFADNRNERSFDKQDFYFACCDEVDDRSKMIVIYRGHHLYGL